MDGIDGNDHEGMSPDNVCVICGEGFTEKMPTRMFKKGIATLANFSKHRKDDILLQKLQSTEHCLVHESCRRQYTDKRQCSDDATEKSTSKKLRSHILSFEWKTNCFLCSEIAKIDPRHLDRDQVVKVRTMEIRESVMVQCRKVHPWSENVQARLCDCIDLVSVEARYHLRCYSNFMAPDRLNRKSGRPVDDVMHESFLLLCAWLETEGDAELYTTTELHALLSELAGAGVEVYSEKRMSDKLKSHYGDHVYFAYMGGSRKEVVCFKNMVTFVISDKWYQDRQNDRTKESERIMVAAAQLIREEIREREYTKLSYPNQHDVRDLKTCR